MWTFKLLLTSEDMTGKYRKYNKLKFYSPKPV